MILTIQITAGIMFLALLTTYAVQRCKDSKLRLRILQHPFMAAFLRGSMGVVYKDFVWKMRDSKKRVIVVSETNLFSRMRFFIVSFWVVSLILGAALSSIPFWLMMFIVVFLLILASYLSGCEEIEEDKEFEEIEE